MTGEADAAWAGKRIGILGGTFDPPHPGHVEMAVAARETLGLDAVFLSPAPDPPHKAAAETTAYPHRFAMAECAVRDVAGVVVTDIEASHRPSFSVDLLRACRVRTGADLYFIIGADSLADLPAWHEPEALIGLCTLVVFPRDDTPARLAVDGEASVVVFDTPVVAISSSEIRAAVAAGGDVNGLVSPGVAAYIDEHGLYRAA